MDEKFNDFIEISNLGNEYSQIEQKFIQKVISLEVFVDSICNLITSNKALNEDEISNYFNLNSKNNVLTTFQQRNALNIMNPTQLPEQSLISGIYEPYISLDVISPEEYLGKIIELVNTCRGEVMGINQISLNQLKIDTVIPLAEVIVNFYDQLKSITKGYASMNYSFLDYRLSSLAKLDILLNGKVIDPLSTIIHKDNLISEGKRICEKLKELIPRQQIEVIIQAAVNSKILARETVKPFRKDVTAKLYGGDISRRKKLLDNQKEGKKKMKSFGTVSVPKEAFIDVLKK